MITILTLYAVAVSMPLTKVTSPSSNAMERFRWRKCCVWLKIRFLWTNDHINDKEDSVYLSAISAPIVNKRQAIDIEHPM